MKDIFVLSKTMLQNFFIFSPKKKQSTRIWTYIGFFLLIAYLSVIAFFLLYAMMNLFHSMNQEAMILLLYAFFITAYTLIFSITTIPSIYYFSKDVEHLLTMPLHAWQIVAAKFFTSFIVLLLGDLLIAIPFLITYLIVVGFNFVFVLGFLLAIFILPLIPFAIASALMIFLFAFVPLIKNKEFFTYLSSSIGIGIALFITLFLQPKLIIVLTDPEALMNLIYESNGLLKAVASYLPTLMWVVRGLSETNLFLILASLLVSVLVSFGLLALVSPLYLRAAIGIDEISRKSPEKRHKQQVLRSSGPMRSIMSYDIKRIIRTPILAMNTILLPVLLPVIVFIPMFTSFSNAEYTQLLDQLRLLFAQVKLIDLLALAFFTSFLLTMLITGFASLSSTAFSREGAAMLAFYSMPIYPQDMINAKIMLAMLFTVIPSVLVITVLIIFLGLPWHLIIIAALASILASLFTNLIALMIDILKPKLVWETEQEAVKQNFMTIIVPVASMFIAMISFGILVASQAYLLLALAVMLISGLISFFIYKICIRLLVTKMPEHIEYI